MSWQPDDRLRSLAISLAKNTGTAGKFHRLKNGTFGLRSWYDEDFLKKAASGADETAKAKKKRAGKKAKAAKAKTEEAHAKGAPLTLCSRGCGKPPHKGGCKPMTSAKIKSHPEAEPELGKEEREE